MVEGARHNFLPINPFNPKSAKCQVSGAKYLGGRTHEKIQVPGAMLWEFSVAPSVQFSIEIEMECAEPLLAYTFSLFAQATASEPIEIEVSFGDVLNRCASNLHVTEELTRFEISQRFSTSPTLMRLRLTGPAVTLKDTQAITIGFAFVTIEEGLFASTPIASPQQGIGFRAGECVSAGLKKKEVQGRSGTVLLNFSPYWTGPELDDDFSAYLFRFISSDKQDEISMFADGADFGKLKAVIKSDGAERVLSTDIIPVRGTTYAVALRWIGRLAGIVVNGYTTVAIQDAHLPKDCALLDKFYLGSAGGRGDSAAFSTVHSVRVYTEWLDDESIKAAIYEDLPSVFPQFFSDWQILQGRSPPQLFATDSWAFEVATQLMILPPIWQESPPIWLSHKGIDESNCRDEIDRHFRARGLFSVPEYESHEGRTDLLIRQGTDRLSQIRIEFKVWGRHDYKEVPTKPLKYFTDVESIGLVVMINPNKRKDIGPDYRRNVLASQTDVKSVISRPFDTEEFPDHFISVHESALGNRVEVLHLVINRQGPFSVKDM